MPHQMHDGDNHGNGEHWQNEEVKRRIKAGVIGEILRNFLGHVTLLECVDGDRRGVGAQRPALSCVRQRRGQDATHERQDARADA